MEILDLRQIRSQHLQALLDEENRIWRDQLHWDYTNSADLIKRFVDARALPGYAAMDRGRAVGYSFFVYEDYKGLIGNLFVSQPYAGLAEGRLLTHVIETMQETPGIRRIEAQLMTPRPGVLGPTFVQEDFQVFDRQFMLLVFDAAGRLAPRAAPQIEFVGWDERYFDQAAALITLAYRNHVDSDINDQYRTPSGAGRFLKNIIHYPGCGAFYPSAALLAFDRATGVLCGMVLTSVVAEHVGHVTQVCVSPEFRDAGVGYELMRRGAEAFRAAGFGGVSLTVTCANRRAVELYERMGFRTLRQFCAYVWDAAHDR